MASSTSGSRTPRASICSLTICRRAELKGSAPAPSDSVIAPPRSPQQARRTAPKMNAAAGRVRPLPLTAVRRMDSSRRGILTQAPTASGVGPPGRLRQRGVTRRTGQNRLSKVESDRERRASMNLAQRPAQRNHPDGSRPAPDRKRVARVLDALEKRYGRPRLGRRLPPLDELVLTILSQNTNDLNRDRAYESLRGRFPTWEAVAAARRAAIEKAIRPGGLART